MYLLPIFGEQLLCTSLERSRGEGWVTVCRCWRYSQTLSHEDCHSKPTGLIAGRESLVTSLDLRCTVHPTSFPQIASTVQSTAMILPSSFFCSVGSRRTAVREPLLLRLERPHRASCLRGYFWSLGRYLVPSTAAGQSHTRSSQGCDSILPSRWESSEWLPIGGWRSSFPILPFLSWTW